MSGHSKWSTIKRQKGLNDIKRGLTFTKISNVITLAAKLGGTGDPDSNPRLRMALETARSVNMPNVNIQRAIDRGLGKLPGQSIEEVLYEGFGPGKVAFIIEGVTDNKLRTNQEVKSLFEHSGGSIAGQGSVLYMFDKVGEIKLTCKPGSSDDQMLEIIDLGVEDVKDLDEDGIKKLLIFTSQTKLFEVSTNLTQAGFAIESSELIYKPNINSDLKDKEIAERVLSLVENLEENDDIHKVYTNLW